MASAAGLLLLFTPTLAEAHSPTDDDFLCKSDKLMTQFGAEIVPRSIYNPDGTVRFTFLDMVGGQRGQLGVYTDSDGITYTCINYYDNQLQFDTATRVQYSRATDTYTVPPGQNYHDGIERIDIFHHNGTLKESILYEAKSILGVSDEDDPNSNPNQGVFMKLEHHEDGTLKEIINLEDGESTSEIKFKEGGNIATEVIKRDLKAENTTRTDENGNFLLPQNKTTWHDNGIQKSYYEIFPDGKDLTIEWNEYGTMTKYGKTYSNDVPYVLLDSSGQNFISAQNIADISKPALVAIVRDALRENHLVDIEIRKAIILQNIKSFLKNQLLNLDNVETHNINEVSTAIANGIYGAIVITEADNNRGKNYVARLADGFVSAGIANLVSTGHVQVSTLYDYTTIDGWTSTDQRLYGIHLQTGITHDGSVNEGLCYSEDRVRITCTDDSRAEYFEFLERQIPRTGGSTHDTASAKYDRDLSNEITPELLIVRPGYVDTSLLKEVQYAKSLLERGKSIPNGPNDHETWNKVLAAFGHLDQGKMTASEAQVNVDTYGGPLWSRIAAAISELESDTPAGINAESIEQQPIPDSIPDSIQDTQVKPEPAIDPELIEDVKYLASQTHHGEQHVDRWNRVLAAFGIIEHDNPITVAEAEANTQKYSSPLWPKIAETLKVIEDANEQQQQEIHVPQVNQTSNIAQDTPQVVPEPTPAIDPELIEDVKYLASQVHHGTEHVDRWNRVLAAFGILQHDNPMTAAEAEANSKKYSSPLWPKIAEALKVIENAS